MVNSCAYLDNARTGAISIGTANKWKEYIHDQLENGALHRDQWLATVEKTRNLVSDLLKGQSESIGFITDVYSGIGFISLSLKKLKKVVLVDHDFPSLIQPWVRNGYELIWIPREDDLTIDLNKIEVALKSGGEILAVSWVQYSSGYRFELDRLGLLCKKYNAKLIIDGTQGFGALPLDLQNLEVDAFVASGFKWMTAGFGVGIAYLSPEFRALLGPDDKNTSGILEHSHPKFQSILGLENALAELKEIGLENIQTRTALLSNYLQNELLKTGAETLSNFSVGNSSPIRLVPGNQASFERLSKVNIRVTFRDDYLRMAPYFYNSEADIDQLIHFVSNNLRTT